MSDTVSAFHTFIDEHPDTCIDLTELVTTIHIEGRISPTEQDAIRQRMWEAWASFRAGSRSSAQLAANSDHAHSDLPAVLPSMADSESVTADRAELRRAERDRQRAAEPFDKAMRTLSRIAPHEMQAVKAYVGTLDDELAAARTLRTSIERSCHE